jgi:hypothetical protein
MHTLIKSLPALYIASAISTLVMLGSVSAAEPTAFELIKEGNRYIGEQSKDKVVQIRSEKSVASKVPNVWFVVFYDPTATLKATEVKFGAGKMLSVKRPMRLLEIAGSDLPLDRDKLKIDSDAAIKTALSEPLLNNIEVTATQLKLERVSQGVLGVDSTGEAAWKLRLWAAKIRNPRRDANIGEVWVSAADGKVIKTDLHLNRLD